MSNKKIFVLTRGEAEINPFKKGINCSGNPYHMRFEVDKPVMLHGFGFAGVDRRSEGSKFLLTISINESWFKKPYGNSTNLCGIYCGMEKREFDEFLSERIFAKEVEPGNDFCIRFKDPVKIPMGILVDLSFQVDPAFEDKPVSLKKMKSGTTKRDIKHEKSGVSFEFLSSTNTITEIYFSLK